MAKLLALAHDRPWSVDLLETEEIWPRRRILRSRYNGPFIAELSASSGPQFASIPDRAVPGLVTRWAQIEELSLDSDISAGDHSQLAQVAVAMIGLARGAQEAGDRLNVRIAP
jgi:hypothetical protein